jgi:hypothetical protein
MLEDCVAKQSKALIGLRNAHTRRVKRFVEMMSIVEVVAGGAL